MGNLGIHKVHNRVLNLGLMRWKRDRLPCRYISLIMFNRFLFQIWNAGFTSWQPGRLWVSNFRFRIRPLNKPSIFKHCFWMWSTWVDLYFGTIVTFITTYVLTNTAYFLNSANDLISSVLLRNLFYRNGNSLFIEFW